ncbi:MAG: hypothetical protein GY853_06690 [PVC group bacterium]|nr:hypothetical protein [PVC group bacterium]
MKATIEFDSPEDQDIYERMVFADSMASVLYNFQEYLRGQIKHNIELTTEESKLLRTVQCKFFELMADKGVDLERLWL